LIHFQNRGNETEVNTFPDHPFASYFSGNTVQICPVGALTAKPFRFKARPWDLEKIESTCTSCSVGCRVTIEASRNHVLRYQGVDIDPVNWGWLCDKGRFDFEAIESDERLSEPLVRKNGELIAATWAEAIGAAADAIGKADATSVAVLGGARLTNEAAYAWAKLAKGVIGTDHVDAQLDDGLPGVAVVGLPPATIDDVCAPGATVVIIDANVKEELPVLFLRLRDAVINRGVKIIELSPINTGLASLAAVSLVHRPGEAHLAMRALVGDGDPAAVLAGDVEAAKALVGDGVVAIVGRSSVGESADAAVEAAAVLLDERADARFLVALRRANARGAIDMGLSPGLLPGRVTLDDGRQWFHEQWATLPAEEGLDATGILTAAAEGRIDVLVLLGADPAADFRDHDLAQRALAGARTVVSIDTFMNRSSQKADVVLPAAGYAETDGTTTNVEGRISVLERKVTPPGTARADWMLAAELAYRLGADLNLESVEGIWNEIEALAPAHAGITRELLLSPAGADGVLVPLRPEVAKAAEGQPVHITGIDGTEPDNAALAEAAEPHETAAPAPEAVEAVERAEEASSVRPHTVRFSRTAAYESPALDSYSLRLIAHRKLYDLGTLVQHAPSIAALAPGSTLLVHPYDLDRLGVSDGGQVKVTSPRTTLTVEAHASTTIPKGSVALTVNQPGPDPADLIDATRAVTDVRIETV
jgi:NADH-quinone oxidoreductase subunit G